MKDLTEKILEELRKNDNLANQAYDKIKGTKIYTDNDSGRYQYTADINSQYKSLTNTILANLSPTNFSNIPLDMRQFVIAENIKTEYNAELQIQKPKKFQKHSLYAGIAAAVLSVVLYANALTIPNYKITDPEIQNKINTERVTANHYEEITGKRPHWERTDGQIYSEIKNTHDNYRNIGLIFGFLSLLGSAGILAYRKNKDKVDDFLKNLF